MPRDRFSSAVRLRLQELLRERFGGDTVDYHLSLGEAEAAHLFFTVHSERGALHLVAPERARVGGARGLPYLGRRSR